MLPLRCAATILDFLYLHGMLIILVNSYAVKKYVQKPRVSPREAVCGAVHTHNPIRSGYFIFSAIAVSCSPGREERL